MSSSVLQSTLFLLIPLFSIALLVLILSHTTGPLKPQAILAYTYIASVTLLATLAGALPLSHSSNSLSEHLIQALLFFFIGIPVLHLPPRYVPNLSIGTLHTSILVITLSIATLLALIVPFLPTVTPLLYIPPSLFLLYTIQAIPRIAYILHNFLHPEDSIQIQFQLHNTTRTIPLTLPSPASTASFPISTDEIHEIRNHHHKIPSVSTTSTITIVDRTRISFPPRLHSPPSQQEQEPNDHLRSQILNSRSRSLLVFILAVQVASLAASACALGVTVAESNSTTTLKTVQTACTVLALTGSISAYLLHTYNLHLRQAPAATPHSIYNDLSTHSSDQLQMIESQQHHSNSLSPMLIQLAPPLAKARRMCANAGVSMGGTPFSRLNDETNVKGATATDSDAEEVGLELDVVMDISRYSMTLERGSGAATGLGSGKKESVDLGLALVSRTACTPVPVPLSIPLPMRVSMEEGSRYEGIENGGGGGGGGGVSASALEKLKEREKEKIQGYYLCSSSSVSTGSPSSPFSPFQHCEMEAETDPSSPDTSYPNLHLDLNMSGGSSDARSGAIDANAVAVGNTNTIAYTHAQVRKRSSFFGWEFAWDQEALERVDDAGKLRSAAGGGGSPARWKSDVKVNAKLNTNALNPSISDEVYTSKKIQPFLIVDHESQGDDRAFFGPSPPLSRPHSLASEADVGGGRMKRGASWGSSVCGIAGVVIGGERRKRKNTLGLGIGIKPLRLSKSFGGNSNRGSGAGNGRGMDHRTTLSGDTGLMCGLSLKRKATVFLGGQGSPVSPVSGSTHIMGQGQGRGDATVTMMAVTAAATPKRLKKEPKPRHFAAVAGSSSSAESDIGERNSKGNIVNHPNGSILDGNQKLDSDDDELDEDAHLRKTPRITTTSYSHSPQSHRYSASSSPQQQQSSHEAAASESRYSSINESCVATWVTTATANTNSPPSLTRRGLSLKRSFKMGSTVGRTLGPVLTLSSAESGRGSGVPSTSVWPCAHKSIRRCESEGFGFREDEKCECEEKKHVVCGAKKGGKNLNDEKEKVEKVEEEAGEEVDVDVETKMRSLVAERVASPSYVRATPATGAGANASPPPPSRSGRRGNPTNYTTVPKSMLHSRPSLPIMNTRVSASESSCSTITQQYQQEHRYQHLQDVYNPSLSTAASRGYVVHTQPHPFVDWFRSPEASNTRGDDVVEPGMEIVRGSGEKDDDALSSPSLLPPISPLFSPMTPPPQSKSLPPTPTKFRSTLLAKSSISSFKQRSAPPALPPSPPGSSEWALFPHSMSTANGTAASMVSLAHSKSYAISQSAVVGPRQGQGRGQTTSRPPSQPHSRPTVSRPSTRLSVMSMGTVKSAFAGVGARVSARMSSNSTSTRGGAGAAAGNAMVSGMGKGMDDIDGDFMDLRDPFASPPPSKLSSVFMGGDQTRGAGDFWISGRAMSSLGGASGAGMTVYDDDDDDDDVEVGVTRRISSVSGGKRNMNTWGRLPMPSISPLSGSTPGMSSPSVSSLVVSGKKAHGHHGERRKHKEKRARKAALVTTGNGVLNETNSSLQDFGAPSSLHHAGEEDTDFGVEEALLSQRLLRRLDSVEWD